MSLMSLSFSVQKLYKFERIEIYC